MDFKNGDTPGEIHPAPGQEMAVITTMPDGTTTKKTETALQDGSTQILEESLDSSGVTISETTTTTHTDGSIVIVTKMFDNAEGIKEIVEERIEPNGKKHKTVRIMHRADITTEQQQQHIPPRPHSPSMTPAPMPVGSEETNPSCDPIAQGLTKEATDEHFVEFPFGSFGRFLCRPACRVLSILFIALIGLAVGLGVGLSSNENGATPQASLAEEEQQLLDLLSDVSTDDGAALSDPTSPQHSAFVWLHSNEEAQNFTDERKVQLYGLSTLFFTMGGEEWVSDGSTGWLVEEDECEWMGIACNEEGAVMTLDLGMESYGMELSGTIPAEVATMPHLRHFLLRGNSELKGSIPTEIGLATSLEFMWLENNGLTGTLPAELGNLKKMIVFAVNGNNLTGTIPTELGNLRNGNSFQFSWNDLTGEMPEAVCALREPRDEGILAFLQSDCGEPNPEVICTCCTGCN